MNWALRKRTDKEMEEEIALKKAYKNFNAKACPLEVVFSDGSKSEVWDLTEQKIVGLIRAIANEMENHMQMDKQRIAWAGEIVKCWGEAHPQTSNKMTAELLKIEVGCKNPVTSDIVRDLYGLIAYKNLSQAKTIANYLNGAKDGNISVDKAQLIEILENDRQNER